MAWAASDGAEISRSRGPRDGIVVLYPRVVPPTDDPVVAALATTLQERVAAAVRRAAPSAPVDVRPAPERVCPQSGCRGLSIGLMLGHDAGGCAALAVVGPPGPVDQGVVTLAGEVTVADGAVPFRTPPETRAVVHEFVPCSQIPDHLDLVALAAALVG
jgi:hypothetical protein